MSKVKIIVGPPCSGKSTYVSKTKSDADVAIDYDKLAQALGAEQSHTAPQSISFVASKARFAAIDAVLDGISSPAWIIHTSPSKEMIGKYEESEADFYFMDTDLATCLQRAEERPSGTAAVIEDWFANRPVLPNAFLINSTENKMSKAYSVLKVKSITDTDDQRIITGIASTPKQDRDDDIMEMNGAKFALPIPLLWQHNHNEPIGEVTEATITDDGILITATIVKIEEEGALKSRTDEAWQSIKSGLVKCLSIGFRLLEYNYLESSYGLHIKEWEWYELSAVTVPANPDAMITSTKKIKQAFSDAQNPTKLAPKSASVAVVPESQKNAPPANNEPPAKPTRTITLVDPNQGSVSLISGE